MLWGVTIRTSVADHSRGVAFTRAANTSMRGRCILPAGAHVPTRPRRRFLDNRRSRLRERRQREVCDDRVATLA